MGRLPLQDERVLVTKLECYATLCTNLVRSTTWVLQPAADWAHWVGLK